jgi:hypothetical protein
MDKVERRLDDVIAIGEPDMYSAGNPVQATTTALKELQVFPQPVQKPHPQIWEPVMKKEIGYDDFCFLAWFELGGFEGREIEDQMQLFAEEVMPVIARECSGKVTCRSAASSMLPDKSGRPPRNDRPDTSSYGKVGNPGWPANSRNN